MKILKHRFFRNGGNTILPLKLEIAEIMPFPHLLQSGIFNSTSNVLENIEE